MSVHVGAVYDATPAPRTPADILAGGADQDYPSTPAPAATGTWLTAGVVDDAATVVGQIFHNADRRDPGHDRTLGGTGRRQRPPDRPDPGRLT